MVQACSSKGKNSTLISQLDLKMAELSHVTLPALVTIALVLVSWLELAWGPIRGEHCGHVTRSPPITAHLLVRVVVQDHVRPPDPIRGQSGAANNIW